VASDLADVRPVCVNADRCPIVQRVPHFVHVADRGRHEFDGPLHEPRLSTGGGRRAVGGDGVALRELGAPEHPDHAPHGVVVDRCLLRGPPHETDDRESIAGIRVKQVLPVVLRMRLGVRRCEPVVLGHQPAQGLAYLRQQITLIAFRLEPCFDVVDELPERSG
jgi:hypothetical protein